MTKRIYTFEMMCERCKHAYIVETNIDGPPPQLTCRECFANDKEIVELEIVRVEVQSC